MKTRFIATTALITLAFACSEPDEEIRNEEPVAEFNFEDRLDRFALSSTSSDPEGTTLVHTWTSNVPAIKIVNPSSKYPYFKLPNQQEPTQAKVKLKVCDQGGACAEVEKDLVIPALTPLRKKGLGKSLESEKSNDVDHPWYLDQMNSTNFNSINCGPASVTMAILWSKENFAGTIDDARNTYRSSGGWWYTDDIINYLNLHSTSNFVINLQNMATVTEEIDKGNIAILCLDMYYITAELYPERHVNKFYDTNTTGWGHFIVVKGYKKVDNKTYFEVYDPFSFGSTYADGNMKGMNRYYSASDLNVSTNNWWDYAIIVSKKETSGNGRLKVGDIVHMPGR